MLKIFLLLLVKWIIQVQHLIWTQNTGILFFIQLDSLCLSPFQAPAITTAVETILPGIGPYKAQMPVKVTNMQLASPHICEHTWGGTIHYSDNVIQQELQRGMYPHKGHFVS